MAHVKTVCKNGVDGLNYSGQCGKFARSIDITDGANQASKQGAEDFNCSVFLVDH